MAPEVLFENISYLNHTSDDIDNDLDFDADEYWYSVMVWNENKIIVMNHPLLLCSLSLQWRYTEQRLVV